MTNPVGLQLSRTGVTRSATGRRSPSLVRQVQSCVAGRPPRAVSSSGSHPAGRRCASRSRYARSRARRRWTPDRRWPSGSRTCCATSRRGLPEPPSSPHMACLATVSYTDHPLVPMSGCPSPRGLGGHSVKPLVSHGREGSPMTRTQRASWRDGKAKEATLDFVQRSTGQGPDFVDRIAAFDNGGTLWVEQPLPPQFDFVFRKWAEEIKADPSLASLQPRSSRRTRRSSRGWRRPLGGDAGKPHRADAGSLRGRFRPGEATCQDQGRVPGGLAGAGPQRLRSWARLRLGDLRGVRCRAVGLMAGWLVIRRVGEDDDQVLVQAGGPDRWHGWRVAVAVFVIGPRRWLNASPANSPGRSGCRAARSRA